MDKMIETLRKNAFEFFDKETLDKVKLISDNIFYNNYCENGVLISREEIQRKIKSQLYESFVQFYGKDKAETIAKRLKETNIKFVYQTNFGKNSIDNFLRNIKNDYFNKKYDTQIDSPQTFAWFQEDLSKCNNNIGKLLESSQSDILYEPVFTYLKCTPKELISNPELQQKALGIIGNIASKYRALEDFSDNPEVNANLQFLDRFAKNLAIKKGECIAENAAELFKYKEKQPETLDEAYQEIPSLNQLLDPIIDDDEVYNSRMFSYSSDIEAYYTSNKKMVTLGAYPPDRVVIHEFIHAIEHSGFDTTKTLEQTKYAEQFRKNEMFNEAITDYFAKTIVEKRKRANLPTIVNPENFESEYDNIINMISPFLSMFTPELIGTRLRENPIEEFARVIGPQEFNQISTLCNELMGLSHDLNIYELSELLDNEHAKQLLVLTESKTKDSSKLRKVAEFIKTNSDTLGTKLREANHPCLTALSKACYGTSDFIGNLTRDHVSKSLPPEIHHSDTMDNAPVMERSKTI